MITDDSKHKSPSYELQVRCRVSAQKCRLQLVMLKSENGEKFWSDRIYDDSQDILNFVDRVASNVS
ncbi:MAG: TolB-like protein [Parasphingorhabdus sp.]|jgi:TolB-like protein